MSDHIISRLLLLAKIKQLHFQNYTLRFSNILKKKTKKKETKKRKESEWKKSQTVKTREQTTTQAPQPWFLPSPMAICLSAALRTVMRCEGLVPAGSLGLKSCTITSTHSCTSCIRDTNPGNAVDIWYIEYHIPIKLFAQTEPI